MVSMINAGLLAILMLTTQMIKYSTHSTFTRTFTVTLTDIIIVTVVATKAKRMLKKGMKMENQVKAEMSYPQIH